VRRGELVALVWKHVDLVSGLLTIRRNLVRRNGTTILKDTKTHQMRALVGAATVPTWRLRSAPGKSGGRHGGDLQPVHCRRDRTKTPVEQGGTRGLGPSLPSRVQA
jgi:integrase